MMSGLEVHHKDGNPRNNSNKNLSLVSKTYNREKTKMPGLHKRKKVKKCHKGYLAREVIIEDF